MGESIASAVIPSLIGSIFGSDAPSYQQPSMDQIETPVQKAMRQNLIDIGNMGYKEGMKYTDEKLFNKNKDFYNSMMNKLQTGAGIAGASNAAAPATTATTNTSTFTPNDQLEKAIKYNDANAKAPFGSVVFDPNNAAAIALAKGEITPAMLDAYKRQKQAADDAALLAKAVK